jgi:hypothetical protein
LFFTIGEWKKGAAYSNYFERNEKNSKKKPSKGSQPLEGWYLQREEGTSSLEGSTSTCFSAEGMGVCAQNPPRVHNPWRVN